MSSIFVVTWGTVNEYETWEYRTPDDSISSEINALKWAITVLEEKIEECRKMT